MNVAELNHRFESEHPRSVLAWATQTYSPTEIALATGFGAEGIVLIDLLANVDRSVPIFYIDTGVLFPETYQLKASIERRYGIELQRFATELSFDEQVNLHGEKLWKVNPDLCCSIRKVEPLREALQGKQAWITAIRREQSPTRRQTGIVEWDETHQLVKLNPLAVWKKKDVWAYIQERGLEYNPLYNRGYASIGCTHCTTPIVKGEDERSGRWRGFNKTECGLHPSKIFLPVTESEKG